MESACLFHKDMMKAFAKHDIRHKVFPNHKWDGSRNYICKVKFPSTGVIPIPPNLSIFHTKKTRAMKSVSETFLIKHTSDYKRPPGCY